MTDLPPSQDLPDQGADLRQRYAEAIHYVLYGRDKGSTTMRLATTAAHAVLAVRDRELGELREQVAFEKHRAATYLGDHDFLRLQYEARTAEATAWQERAEHAEAELEQLRYERRLLGAARMVLDLVAAGDAFRWDQARQGAEDVAQRIVDEIGHPVTDEPALGPGLRAELASAQARIDRVRADCEEQTAQPLGRDFVDHSILKRGIWAQARRTLNLLDDDSQADT